MPASRAGFAHPHDVSDLQMAFPANVVGTFLPPRKWFAEDSVPEEWEIFVHDLFGGFAKDVELLPRDGIDPALAWRHASMILGSFEPKHEHKIEGVAWLLHNWFEMASYSVGGRKVTVTRRDPEPP